MKKKNIIIIITSYFIADNEGQVYVLSTKHSIFRSGLILTESTNDPYIAIFLRLTYYSIHSPDSYIFSKIYTTVLFVLWNVDLFWSIFQTKIWIISWYQNFFYFAISQCELWNLLLTLWVEYKVLCISDKSGTRNEIFGDLPGRIWREWI